jgi:hypothetical protein
VRLTPHQSPAFRPVPLLNFTFCDWSVGAAWKKFQPCQQKDHQPPPLGVT